MVAPATRLRSTTSAMLLMEFATQSGVRPARLLGGTGLEPAQLHDPDAEIETAQEISLALNVIHELGDEPGLGLGLRCGVRYHTATMGVLGCGVMASPDLRTAVDIGVRYSALCQSYSRITRQDEDNDVLVVFDHTDLPPELHRFEAERNLAATLTAQCDLVPNGGCWPDG